MHLKNFSMILSGGKWVLSPAYDLLNVSILLPEDPDELALTLEGKKKKIKFEHFENFGTKMGLSQKQMNNVFSRFNECKNDAFDLIDDSFLSTGNREEYKSFMTNRYERLSK